VYADSLTSISAPDFRFSDNPDYPNAVADFNKSFIAMRGLPCDIIVSVHPEFSDLWPRLERRDRGKKDALIDKDGCRRYADNAQRSLEKRLASKRER
jgi:metallo-beta-lactamase class B